ncbi:hypothetical protein GCM10027563_28180 [Parasphingorhabdus pacifica]
MRKVTSWVLSLGVTRPRCLSHGRADRGPDGADRAGPGFGHPGGRVHGQDVAAGHTGLAGRAAVDKQLVYTVGPGRDTLVDRLGGQAPWPTARRRTGHGPERQPVRQHPVIGALQPVNQVR